MNAQPSTSPPRGHAPSTAGEVTRDEAYETSRLVVELLHAARASRRDDVGGEGGHAGAGRPGDAGAPGADGHGDSHSHEAPPSDHAIRAAIYLYQHGGATVGSLATGLGISRGWASRVAEELVARGHVAREGDPDDRRVVNLRLTDLALDEIERAYRWRGDVVAAALAEHAPAERAAIRRFLRRVAEGLSETVTPEA